MSLKMPRIGRKFVNYFYSISNNQQGDVYVIIKFYPNDNPNADIPLYKIFEIRPDERWNIRTDLVVKKLFEILNSSLNGEPLEINEDRDRMYLWFNNNQFTGNIIL